jgi:hypothetical protein
VALARGDVKEATGVAVLCCQGIPPAVLREAEETHRIVLPERNGGCHELSSTYLDWRVTSSRKI